MLDDNLAMIKHARAEHGMALSDAIDLAKRSRVLLEDNHLRVIAAPIFESI
jgi:hypothetical protein